MIMLRYKKSYACIKGVKKVIIARGVIIKLLHDVKGMVAISQGR